MKVWCLLRDQFAHVRPVESAFNGNAEFIFDELWDPATLVNNRPDIVLCVNDYPYDVVRCLDAARQAGIPSLLLQDGILEWRCQYHNPLFGAGGGAPQHQPVMTDKIACIGHQSARQIAAWGNAAKVETTGMPRLDHLFERKSLSIQKPGSRILVMTAKNPGFTAEQRELTLGSLKDVKVHLESLAGVEVLWRVSKSVAVELGVENQLDQISSSELAKVLEQVDAVITTPSTAMLEAMLLGRPVAALDYHNAPRFLQTAWTISAQTHISLTIAELLNPPAAKIAFQQDCLADSLECSGSAAERVCDLMGKMVSASQEMRQKGWQLNLPHDLLGQQGTFHTFGRPPLSALYEGQSLFHETSLEALQVRLARAENENERLKSENAELKKRVQLGSWFKQGVRHLTQAK
ncbi:MAG: hypothetical protein JWQ71_282 [Pedosphaera sp.]|nr:hypothetical protein [Pedosphaera sp.]